MLIKLDLFKKPFILVLQGLHFVLDSLIRIIWTQFSYFFYLGFFFWIWLEIGCFLQSFVLVLQKQIKLLGQVIYPLFLEKTLKWRVFVRFFDIRKRIKLQELVGFGQIISFVVKIIPKGRYLLFRNARFGFQSGMNVVNQKIHPNIKL